LRKEGLDELQRSWQGFLLNSNPLVSIAHAARRYSLIAAPRGEFADA
jgi:hypothetical protein